MIWFRRSGLMSLIERSTVRIVEIREKGGEKLQGLGR